MNLYPAFIVLVVLSCSDTSPRNERGTPGAPGLNGKDGLNGMDGRSCKAQEANEGIQVLCDGQAPFFLPHGKNGKDGINGKDGVSCQIKSSAPESVILSCPDASSAAGFKDVEVKNGKDGTSCQATRSSFGGVTIKCGNTEFRLEDGNDGRNGRDGQDGSDGKDGQDDFSTELSEAEIIGDITTESSSVECSVKIKSNDQNLAFRPFMGYLLHDGQVVSQQRLHSQDRIHEFDRMKFKVKLYRDFLKPLLPLQCRAAVFADREIFRNTPIALTSYSVSAPKIVLNSPKVLQSADDFAQTVASSTEGSRTLKLTLINLKAPGASSQCAASLLFNADVYDSSTRETRARFNMESRVSFSPVDGENNLAFALDGTYSLQISNVRDVRMFMSCSGDREYKTYLASNDPSKRSFEIPGTFFVKP